MTFETVVALFVAPTLIAHWLSVYWTYLAGNLHLAVSSTSA